jgi:cell division protein FtsQ
MHQSIGKRNKIVIYIIFLFILSTTTKKLSEQQKKYSLKINKIEVTGLTYGKNLEIQNELSSIFYQNIFILGKKEIDIIINKHNIVEEYNIKKFYPSKLYIEIKPAKFIAKVNDGNEFIVGSNGKLISSEMNNKILPYIFGEFNSKNFLEFKQNVEKSKFNFNEFKSVYFFRSSRWDILTIDGILIKLPQSDISESLNRAYKILASTQFKDKNIIDLRIKSHLIVK